jgi:hypothetical protein
MHPANEYFAALGRDPATVRGRAIDPAKKRDAVKFAWSNDRAQALSDEGFNIYAVVNPGGDTKESITAGVVVFVEFDKGSLEWQQEVWKEFGLPEPTFQVFTGGKSIHHFWTLSHPVDVPTWTKLQEGLIAVCVGCDPVLKDPSRVMRVPGFVHQGTGGMCVLLGGAA